MSKKKIKLKKKATKKSKKDVVLIISDYHAPFNHPDAIEFLRAVKKKYKPTSVYFSGDEADFQAMSFHDSNPDLPAAGDELKQAIKELKKLYRLFPKCTVVGSNHGSMVLRKALAKGFPKAVIKSYNEILQAPKTWKWVDDVIFKTPLGPVYLCHGKAAGAGVLSKQYGMSTIQGHFHEKADITYTSTPERLMFDMHVGCLVDDDSLAMQYNKINPKRPVISIGLIIDGIPQITPMILTKAGKWVGKL